MKKLLNSTFNIFILVCWFTLMLGVQIPGQPIYNILVFGLFLTGFIEE